VSFDRPWALFALIPLVLVFVHASRALGSNPLGARGRRASLVRATELAVLLALALAAAGPRLVRRSDRLATVVVIDRSRSTDLVPEVDAKLRRLLDEAPRSMRSGDLLGVVGFAREADTSLIPSSLPRDARVALPQAQGTRDETDLAAAIQHALGDVPADANGRVVLISDGDETRGDSRSAASLAAASGVPVDTVVLERPVRRDVAAVRVRAPDRVEPGNPIDLALVVRSTRASQGRVELLRDGTRVSVSDAQWGAGEDVIHLRDVAQAPGLHRYEVRVVPGVASDDEVAGNEITAGFVRVTGGARAVVVTSDTGRGANLAQALREAGLQVDTVSPASAPATSGEWGRYDLIVLSDVRARDLDPGALPVLREQVRELGTGFFMLGSDRAFGPGGYGHSPVEDILPVTLDLRQHRMLASVALAIMIDRSGSMSAPTRDGRTKLDLANEGAARSGAMLDARDQIAIGHVDTETDWTLRLRPADNPAAITRAALAGTPGGGGIATDVALRDAYGVLRGAHATIRHVILLADGDDAEDSDKCAPMTEAARRENITTSVVAIGRGHDEPNLERIARAGGGRYYLTEDARSIPQIFTEETVVAARNPMREEPFRPRFTRSAEALRGVDLAGVPTVQGYVTTERRARAEVLATALEDDPWLARWQIGTGRSAALMSDLEGRWTRDFVAWPGASAIIGQMGLWLARGVSDSGVRVMAVAHRGRVHIDVDATTGTGRWDTGLDLEARVVTPAGTTVRVPLEARAAGRYEAEIEAPRSGSYLVTVLSGGTGVVGVTGAEVIASAEVTAFPGNAALLAEIADRSGGRVRTHLRDVFNARRETRATSRSLVNFFLWTALALLVVEIALRRLPAVSLAALRALWRKVRERLFASGDANVVTTAPVATEDALEALRARRAERPRAREVPVVQAPVEVAETAPEAPAEPAKEPPSTPHAEDKTSLDALVSRKRSRQKR
jgi:uncharacterized membrane protein